MRTYSAYSWTFHHSNTTSLLLHNIHCSASLLHSARSVSPAPSHLHCVRTCTCEPPLHLSKVINTSVCADVSLAQHRWKCSRLAVFLLYCRHIGLRFQILHAFCEIVNLSCLVSIWTYVNGTLSTTRFFAKASPLRRGYGLLWQSTKACEEPLVVWSICSRSIFTFSCCNLKVM